MDVNQLLRKHTGTISLIVGIYGLIVSFIQYFQPGKKLPPIWGQLKPVAFELPLPEFIGRNGIYIDLVFFIMMVTGSLVYRKSKLDTSGLLRFCYSIIYYGAIILIIVLILWMVSGVGEETIPWNFSWWIGYHVILILVSRLAIKNLESEVTATIASANMESNAVIPPVDNLSKRLLHFLLDYFIVIALTVPFITYASIELPHWDEMREQTFAIAILILIQRFIFYLVLEVPFRATPSKYATGVRVVNSRNGRTPDRRSLIQRTFCRFIPFEPFSFVGGSGWHDTLSQTIPVEIPASRSAKFYGGVWLLLLIVFPIGNIMIQKMKAANFKEKKEVFADQAKQSSRKELIANLSKDYLIMIEPKMKFYRDPYLAFKVDSIGQDSIWGYIFNVETKTAENPVSLNVAYHHHVNADTTALSRKNIEALFLSGGSGPLMEDDKPYSVYDMHIIDRPLVVSQNKRSVSVRPQENIMTITWHLDVLFAPLTLDSIQSLEGDVKWLHNMPRKAYYIEETKTGYVEIKAEFKMNTKPFKALLHFSDAKGSQFRFMMESFDKETFVYRKF